MKHKLLINNIGRLLCISLLIINIVSCEKFLEVDLDDSQVLSKDVFSTDENVTSALNGLYQSFLSSSWGGREGIPILNGLLADELNNLPRSEDYIRFEENNLLSGDRFVSNLWNSGYKIIYQSNDILEGLEESSSLSEKIKTHATGEALFVRAFSYFYLTNLFGDVPLLLTTDYRLTSVAPRERKDVVMEQVAKDLQHSIELLDSVYIRLNKVRPNKFAAEALLARVYLYQNKWSDAEQFASNIINSSLYSLPIDLSIVFKNTSSETIWQLASENGFNTQEGDAFIIEGDLASSSVCTLSANTLKAFETGDQRRMNWVGTWQDVSSGLSFDYIFKYKAYSYIPPTSEFYIALRLAEIFLIRSEARAQLSDIDGSIADLDMIRIRAGLNSVADTYGTVDQTQLLDLIFNERRIELLGEWGHRWFDLKRSGRAETVLGSIKSDFSLNDLLYPIPALEFSRNPFLGDQNSGY